MYVAFTCIKTFGRRLQESAFHVKRKTVMHSTRQLHVYVIIIIIIIHGSEERRTKEVLMEERRRKY